MSSIEIESYEQTIKELESIEKEYNELKNDEKVKRFNTIQEYREILISNKNNIYKKMKLEEYSNCNHLLITTSKNQSKLDRNKEIKYCSCLKCGLNEKVLNVDNWYLDYDQLTFDEQIMFDFFEKKSIDKDNITDIESDFELAKAVYDKIKEKYPNISDRRTIKYLGIALDNISNIRMTDARKESRIKRLGLKKDFNNWTKADIIR